MNNKDTALIMLTYMRTNTLKASSIYIENQTCKDFDLFISNSGPYFDEINKIFSDNVKSISYEIINDSNDQMGWRKHVLARSLAQKGYKKIIFLDDDIIIPVDYVEKALNQYEENSYKSWWAWDLNDGSDYYNNRTKITDSSKIANYCGSGACIVDAKVFLEDDYFNNSDTEILYMDDIWLSFYVSHILKWKMTYLDIPGVRFGIEAGDIHSLHVSVLFENSNSRTKDEYIKHLKKEYGWLT